MATRGVRMKAKPWRLNELRTLRRLYPDTVSKVIAHRLDKTLYEIYHKAAALGLKKNPDFTSKITKAKIASGWRSSGTAWTKKQIYLLCKLFPHSPTKIVATRCNHSESSTSQMAARLGIKKTELYLTSPAACRLRRGDNVGIAYRYPKGHVPANKGLRRPGWHAGRMRETQFKKGQKPHTWLPLGSVRFSKEGYLRRKVTDTGYPPHDWQAVHRLLWEEKYGPIPAGYHVGFIDGNKKRVVIENLVLLSRQDLARKNRLWNRYPRELAEVIHLNGVVKAQITRRLKREEQNRRSA